MTAKWFLAAFFYVGAVMFDFIVTVLKVSFYGTWVEENPIAFFILSSFGSLGLYYFSCLTAFLGYLVSYRFRENDFILGLVCLVAVFRLVAGVAGFLTL